MDESRIIQFFTNKLDSKEYEEVSKWINESAENETLAKELFQIYVASEMEGIRRRSNPLQIQRDIKRKQQVLLTSGKRNVWNYLQRVAAILFIPLCIGTAYHYYSTRQEPVRYMETHATAGMICSVELPDGSKVWLNSDSRLKYPVTFTGDTRSVYLSGEAYFSVEKDSKRRFVVETDGISAEVFGTEFNMDAYPNSGFVSTTLVEGAVNLNYKGVENLDHTFAMSPNQKMVYTKNDKKLVQKTTYLPNDVAWKNGQIVLRNTPLEDALWILSKRFNVDFEVQKPEFKDYSFTGVFNDQQLSVILDHFKIASNIKYRTEEVKTNADGLVMQTRIILY